MSRITSKPAAELVVGDFVLAVPSGEGPVTRIEDNPARGSTGAYRRVYYRDLATDRTRSFSAYPVEDVTVVVNE